MDISSLVWGECQAVVTIGGSLGGDTDVSVVMPCRWVEIVDVLKDQSVFSLEH